METTLTNCKSCEALLNGPFCSHCGQKVIEERYTLKIIFNDFITNFFNLEKGFFYTLKKLFTIPEEVIAGYLDGQTKKYYNPIRFFLIWISLQVLVTISFDIWKDQFEQVSVIYERIGLIKTEAEKIRMAKIATYVQRFLTVIPLFLAPFFSYMSYKIFSREKLYFAEHCIINLYVISMSTVVAFLFAVAYAIFPSLIDYSSMIGLLTFVYFYAFVYKRFFKSDTFSALLFGFATIIGGYLLFFLFCALIGLVGGIAVALTIFFYKKTVGG